VGTLVAEIGSATHEQLNGISQVNQAVSQLDVITQQNAALVEQVAAATQQLSGQAGVLTQTVRVFKVAGAGDGQPAPDAVALRRQMKRAPGAAALTAA
jgi:aerotaxis receptor